MYVSSMLRTGRKHWYWVLAGVVVTVLLAVAALSKIPADYSAKASVLLLPAKTPNGGDNPLLGIGGLQPTADTMARAMTDSVVAEQLTDAGATGKYEVILDPISKGPVLLVTAEGKSPEEAITTLRLVVGEVPKLLNELQAKIQVPTKAALSTMVIAEDQEAELVLKSRIRLVGAVVGLGVGITFGLLVFFESRDQQRSWRKAARSRRNREAEEAEPPARAVSGVIAEPADRRWTRDRPSAHRPGRTANGTVNGTVNGTANGSSTGIDEETVWLRR